METATKKRNEKKKILPSRIAASCKRTESFATESSTSRDISTLRNTFCKNKKPVADKACNRYENEYTLYLLRKLQRKIVENESGEREEQAKRCLVALKQEYQELLNENVGLHEECKKTQLYGEAIHGLDKDLAKGREVLKVLRETDFMRVMKMMNEDLGKFSNSVALVDLEKKEVEHAFENGLLGASSSVYKLLKDMEHYASEHKELIADIVQELKDIQRIDGENEMLRKKCCELAEGIRSSTIRSNYHKFYEMALEACKDVRDAASMSVTEDGPCVRKSEESGFRPFSSSTPS